MITVGVDLAAEPKTTAVAVLEWRGGRATVTAVERPADDATIVGLIRDAVRIGIDSPLGWPERFVDFVNRHRDGRIGVADGATPGWRKPLVNRVTDLACAEFTRRRAGVGVRPLSVSADLLGHTAMRCSVLLAELAQAGVQVDRTGVTGHVTEVYPAACLALWGIKRRSYKGPNSAKLPEVVDEVQAAAPWLDLGTNEQRCRTSDHVFDAVIAALGARAAALGRVTQPAAAEAEVAAREGWIALPTGGLADLCTGGVMANGVSVPVPAEVGEIDPVAVEAHPLGEQTLPLLGVEVLGQ